MSDGAPADLYQDITFRAAEPRDVRLLATLNQQLIRDEQHRNLMSLEELEQRMSGFLSAGYEVILFESDPDVLGYALYRVEPGHLYLRQFYVRQEFRRRGIGSTAVMWLQQHVWRNHPRIRLDVLTTNSAAQAFWRSVGFRDYCVTMEYERDDDGQQSPTAAESAWKSD